jgi:hypothetical protein
MKTTAVWVVLAMAGPAIMVPPNEAATVWNSISPYVSPAHPREDLSTTVGAYGLWPDSCIPVDSAIGVYAGNLIYIEFYDDPFAYPYCYGQATDFGTQAGILLPAGTYGLYASIFTNMAWFPFDPPDWRQTHTQYLTALNVYYLGDINGDWHVDVADLLILAASFGRRTGDPGFDARCDFNADDAVDVSDLLILAGNWGT